MPKENDEKPYVRVSQTYVLAIQYIFGVIIAVSFFVYADILVPFSLNFEAGMVLVAYITVIASFIGYALRIAKFPHQNVKRFIVDAILLYLYFQLIYAPLNSNFIYYLMLFPMIFAGYLVWGYLEYREYILDDKYEKVPLKLRLRFSAVCFILSLGVWIGYYLLRGAPEKASSFNPGDVIDWIYLFVICGVVIGFRFNRKLIG